MLLETCATRGRANQQVRASSERKDSDLNPIPLLPSQLEHTRRAKNRRFRRVGYTAG